MPPVNQTANGGNFVDIGNAGLAGGLAGGKAITNAWGTFELGGSMEISVVLADNKSGITGSWMFSAWPYAVWSPASSGHTGPGGALSLPLGVGYRFY